MQKQFGKIRFQINQYSSIVSNFSYLTILEIFRLTLPFVSYPYLIRVLGSSVYGQVIFAQVIVSYFIIFVNYGFNISAVKDISINRNNLIERSKIITSVFTIKLFLFLISMMIMITLIFSIPSFRAHKLLYLFSMGLCLYETIFPLWYFQGVEKMKYITILSIFSRVVFTILIFIFIKSKADYFYVPLLNGIGALAAGFIAIYIIFKKENNKILLPPANYIRKQVIHGFPFFLSRASTVFNSSIPKLIAGSYLGMDQVAIYDLAQKLIDLCKIPFGLLNQAIYPNVAKSRNMRIVDKSIKLSVILGAIITLVLVLLRKHIVLLLGGVELIDAGYIIILLSPSIIISAINFFLGNTALVVFNYNKEFNLSVIYSTFVYLLSISILFLIGHLELKQLAIISVGVQLFILLYRYYYCKLFKIL